MSSPFAACSQITLHLSDALRELSRVAAPLQLEPLEGREWFEVLTRKLLPQLDGEPFLVAAVVGGTNIGKSVVFNHVAGCRASATSPLASGTKHPVCLVPEGFQDRHDLSRIFEGFELQEWSTADAALDTHETHQLYWRTSNALPGNLLVLDTPDIDSDAPVNWLRADRIRHCADILIAVLTQQKYNDAAVKQFFRKAAAEDKAVLVIFNQCLLPEDEQYWPMWLNTFTRETGVEPDLVYVSPNDRRAAEENRLPFSPRTWPVLPGTVSAEPATTETRNLGADLAGLHFSAIKLRTLRGSLSNLVSPDGVPSYLGEIRTASTAFQSAAELMSAHKLAQIDNWPLPPTPLLVSQIREWWRSHREGWTRTVHDIYGTVGETVLFPFRWVTKRITGDTPDPLEVYRQQEWNVILQTVNQLYDELGRLGELGNELLRPRLERLLAGSARSDLVTLLQREHQAARLGEEFSTVVNQQMQLFAKESPSAFSVLRRLDSIAAAARPMTSVAIFALAAGPVGHAVLAPLTDVAAQSLAIHIVGDVAGGTGAVVVGEAALAQTAGGIRQVEARLRSLHAACTAQRVAWFTRLLRKHLLGDLQAELEAGANIPHSMAFRTVEASTQDLRQQVVETLRGAPPGR